MRRRVSIVVCVFAARSTAHATPTDDLDLGLATKCKEFQLAPLVVTSSGESIPADGGVLVAWKWVTSDAPVVRDLSQRGSMKFSVAVTTAELAPGVTVYRPTNRNTRTLKLLDGGTDAVDFVRDPRGSAASLPAPSVVRVHQTLDQGRQGSSHITIEAELGDKPPPSAVGVIVYRITAKRSVALSFASLPEVRTTRIEVYSDPGRCATNPKGMTAAAPEDLVALAWVDAFGRVSQRGNAIKVAVE